MKLMIGGCLRWVSWRYRSDKYIVSGRWGCVQNLKERGAEDNEQEDSQKPWTDLAAFFFFLNQ